jgi:hypothetical protein
MKKFSIGSFAPNHWGVIDLSSYACLDQDGSFKSYHLVKALKTEREAIQSMKKLFKVKKIHGRRYIEIK